MEYLTFTWSSFESGFLTIQNIFKMSHLEHLKLFVCLNSVAAFSIKFLKSLSQRNALGSHSSVWKADEERERKEIFSFYFCLSMPL